jgi:hypothetical protein
MSGGPSRAAAVAIRWCRESLVDLPDADTAHRRASIAILRENP